MTRPRSNELAKKWFQKANDDLVAAHELLDSEGPAWIIAFHCQQAVEKYLKGYGVMQGKSPRKIHDLVALARALKVTIPKPLEHQLIELSQYYITGRYPLDIDEGITRNTAERMYQTTKTIIEILKKRSIEVARS